MGTWKKASQGGGVIWCHDDDGPCFVTVQSAEPGELFAAVAQDSPVYDKGLAGLGAAINQLVGRAEAEGKRTGGRDAALKIGFLATSAGFVPVWKREVGDGERIETLVDRSTLTALSPLDDAGLLDYLKVVH